MTQSISLDADADVYRRLATRYPHGMAVYRVDGLDAEEVRVVHLNRQAVQNIRRVVPDFADGGSWTMESLTIASTSEGEHDAAVDSDAAEASLAAITSGQTIEKELEWAGGQWRAWYVPIDVRHVAVIFVEITDLKTTIAKLERARKAADQFAHVASHDLKEPLRSVRLVLDVLAEDHPTVVTVPGVAELLGEIRREVDRANALVGALLAFSRATRGLHAERVEVAEVARSVLLHLNGRVSRSGARIAIDAPHAVNADRAMVERILENLMNNAIKFAGDAPPVVHVTSRVVGDVVEIAVRDRGIGIAPRHAVRIGEPFYRVHASADYDGTGIGLALVQQIVDAHGGELLVHSAGEGLGTTVSFTLPRAP